MNNEIEFSKNEIDEFYKLIGKNVAKIRKSKDISQLELSLKLGYKSVSLVAGAEICYNGIHFNLKHLYKISKILNTSMNEFFIENI